MFFSTRGIAPTKRSVAWQDVLSCHCAPFVTEASTSEFEASIELRMIGTLHCCKISQTPGTARRSSREIDSRSPSAVIVLTQVAGTASIAQAGRSVSLAPGGMTVLDLQQPVTMRFDRRSIQLALHLPKNRLSVSSDRLMPLLANSLPEGVGAVIGPLIRASFDQLDSDDTYAATVSEAMIALLDAVLSRSTASPPADRQHVSQMMQMIQDYAGKHLYEELTPAMIAHANNISERTLHRVFGSHGISVSQWIKECRLERCAVDLRDPGLARRTVTEIAFQWGFNSAAHFSRVFRLQFGLTPSQYRARALAKPRANPMAQQRRLRAFGDAGLGLLSAA